MRTESAMPVSPTRFDESVDRPLKRTPRWAFFVVTALWSVTMAGYARGHGNACADLKTAHFANTTISASHEVPAGEYEDALARYYGIHYSVTLPAYCRVSGTVAPAIHFEAWLPAATWNGKLEIVGTSGFGGTINTSGMATALRAGYATATNDGGHDESNHEWMKSKELVRLWGHESVHRMTAPVKALVDAYYRRRSRQSYFAGCSTGGAQAMEEAEFYPSDFDGIVANSPGMAYAHLMLSFLWSRRVATAHSDSLLPPDKLQLLHRSAMSECDTLDGVKDDVLEDPRRCHFDPDKLRCKAEGSEDCLTANQIATVRGLMSGPQNPRTGEQIYPGFSWGSEAAPEYTGKSVEQRFGWSRIQGPLATRYAIPLLAQMVFKDPNWTGDNFDFDRDVQRVDAELDGVITATSPDLRAFRRRGSKLIMTQGWADPLNPPTYPIEYMARVTAFLEADSVRRHARPPATDSFFRLFMAPGMGHCGFGPGPNDFDAVAALDRWVVDHVAPERIVAAKHKTDDPRESVVRTRPLCPYPLVAHWRGTGSTDEAENFKCASD